MTTETNIEEIRARLDQHLTGLLLSATAGIGQAERLDREQYHKARTVFIANAPADIDWLLKRVEELEEALAGIDSTLRYTLYGIAGQTHSETVDVLTKARRLVEAVLNNED